MANGPNETIEVLRGTTRDTRAQLESLQGRVGALATQIERARATAARQTDAGAALKDPYVVDLRVSDLQRENFVLGSLIKHYESTLEIVMAKLRSQSAQAQRERDELRTALEAELRAENARACSLAAENTLLRAQVAAGISVVREALAAAADDADATAYASDLAALISEHDGLRAALGRV